MYKDKALYVFTNGEEWFDEQIKNIHYNWEQSGTWLKVEDIDVVISQAAWECNNGY